MQWILKPQPSARQLQAVMRQLHLKRLPALLFAQRGINTAEQARAFCRPKLSDLHDPFLMRDMYTAVERLHWAIQQQEPILLYGDYDVDGTTATAMMYRFLKPLHPALYYYTPNRHIEGYGVSIQGVDYAIAHGCKLMITLDCGIKDFKAIEYARKKGIDVIVCDHHLPGERLPGAKATLNPKRTDCPYPYKELSGCGVAFKLMQGYAQAYRVDERHLYAGLDLVALSIACDIVPIQGENRTLAYFGLKKLKKSPLPGIKELLQVAGFAIDRDYSISDLVFGAGPRINAAGRLEHAQLAIELLISDDPADAYDKALYIHRLNQERKQLDEKITAEALQMIEKLRKQGYESHVLFHKHWHKGIIGIVASRCIEQVYRPTVILTESNGKATGSARSIAGFDLYRAIDACSDLLESYGGHAHAAGLTLSLDKIAAFRERFEQVARQQLRQVEPEPTLEVDAFVSLADLDQSTERIISELAPFGPGNEQPLLVSRVQLAEPARTVGQEGSHLKLCVKEDTSAVFDAIAFRMGEWASQLTPGQSFYICYHLEQNEYRGNKSLQLRVKDIKVEAPAWEKETFSPS
ncbi:MAG: single-stranded-DNA-specific exonuclease RecJ [Thermonema sp.]|uniref:single-stranded-DNA-specific exonuclease RecJ n=1 Tax=Thermonema sp. TaxID=2231181 RepID=UPI0021DCEF86|nr:single-stranded-DNA-specific exonuclease RecJ [Thermonema sp.]GIV40553.1 MAG: single-stranded-DNA-specific exonuclease RecJ [Thermonema sp.]